MPSKKRKPKAKTSVESSGPTEVELVPQPHGGALQVGNPGNRGGGRPPDEWKALLAKLSSRAKTVGALGRILRDPDHQHFANAFKYVNSRSYPELEPVIIAAKLRASVSNTPAPVGGITINFNFVAEGTRYVEPAEVVSKPNGSGNGNGHG